MAVYLVQRGDDGPVKIGFTTSIESRLSSLRTASPEPLNVIRVFHGTINDERRLHAALAQHRLNGEWFRPVPEVLSVGHDLAHLPIFDEHYERRESDCPLVVWRKTNQVRVTAIAKALGTTKQAISRYEAASREPSFAVMHAICRLTDGAVAPNDWVNWWSARAETEARRKAPAAPSRSEPDAVLHARAQAARRDPSDMPNRHVLEAA